jgi:hypothetical protein
MPSDAWAFAGGDPQPWQRRKIHRVLVLAICRPRLTHNMDLAGGPAGVACGRARSSSRISSMGAAMSPVVSSRRRCCARVIRVDVALGRAAGSRRRALGQREEGAILGSASSQGDDVHAYRKSRIICLSPGLPWCRDHSDRQNRQSQNAHRNPLRNRHDIQRTYRSQSIHVLTRA